MVAIVAAVGVDVIPVTDKFAARLASKLLPAAGALGATLGSTMGKSIADGVGDGVDEGTKKAAPAAKGTKAGTEYGGAFAAAIKRRLEGALKSLPDAEIDLDSSDAERELAQIRKDMLELRDAKIGVDIDADAALARIYELQARLEELRRSEPTVDVDIDAGAALAEILLLRRELAKLDGKNVRVDLKADGASALSAGLKNASASMGLFSAESATSNLAIVGLGSAGAALAPAIVPAATSAAAAVALIANAGVAAGAALGVAALAFSGITDAVSALDGAAKQGTKSTSDLMNRQLAIADASQGVAKAERGVADARIQNARDLERAERGVADAQGALESARRRVADAEQAVVDARQKVVDADQNVVDAQQRVIDAQDDVVRATQRVADAEGDLSRAQEDAKLTQESLSAARKDAQRQLEDYANAVKGGAIDEEQARLRVTQALLRYREAMVDRKASGNDREEALLAYREAIQNYDELQTRNKRLAEDKADADKKGVEGSDAVVAAQRRIVDSNDAVAAAQQRLTDTRGGVLAAQRQVTDAQRGVVSAQRDAATARRGVADAQRDVVDAQQGVVKANQDVALAVQNVGDTQRSNSERMISATESVASAQRSLQRALAQTGSTGQTAMDKVNAAMANLSPAGQAFARFVESDMKPVFYDLRNTAQTALLPLVTTAFNTMRPLFPVLGRLVGNVGKALGQLLIQGARTFTSPFWMQFFTFLGNTIGPNLVWMAKLGLAVAKMFAILFKAFEPVGRTMGGQLADLAGQAAQFLAAWVQSDDFQKFVAYMVDNAPLLGGMLLALLKLFIALGIALAPLGPIVLRAVTAISLFLAGLDPKVLLYVIGFVVVAFAALAIAIGNIGLAIPLVIAALTILSAFWIRTYREVSWFRAIVDTTVKVLGAVFTWLWKYIIKPVAIGIAVAIVVLWVVLKAIFVAIVWFVSKVLGPIFGFLWRNWIKPNVGFIILVIQVAWAIIKVILGLIILLLIRVGQGFLWLYTHGVKPAFKWIADGISFYWKTRIQPVLDIFANFIEKHITPKWKVALAVIKGMWDNIRKWAKVPVEFFVVTIINKGLIGGFNKMVEPISKKLMIDPVKWPPPGWARGGMIPHAYDGGIVPGYTPGRDTHLAAVGGGEGILRPEVTRVLGKETIDSWNYNARTGKSGQALFFNKGGIVGAYKNGGLVGSGPGTFPFMKNWLKLKFPQARAMTYQPSFGYHRGNPSASYAADIFAPNMVEVALAIKKAFKPKIKELIHSPLGNKQVWNGQDYTFTGADLVNAHYNHVHWAMLADGQGSNPGFFDFLGKLGRTLSSPLTSGMNKLTRMMHGDTPIAKLMGALGKKAVTGLVQKGKDIASQFLDVFTDKSDTVTAKSGTARSAQEYARSQFKKFGWGVGQVQPLISLWNGESGWNYLAKNASSGAYGIPQALPGSKMASAGSDWASNFKTQVDWGLRYIKDRYGAPSNAFNQWTSRSPHWYDGGGVLPPGLTLAMNGTGRNEYIRTHEQEMNVRQTSGSMTLRVIVDDGVVPGLVRVEVDQALGSLADAHVYGGVS